MQNTQIRTQRIIQHLEDKWQLLEVPSPQSLSQTMAFVTGMLEPWHESDKIAGLQGIAEYVAAMMNMHLLNLLAIFHQRAEEEGISLQDRNETLNYVMPVFTRVMKEVSVGLSIQSLDDLAALINITARLQILSRTDSADEAQNWLYELPAMYQRQLINERLLADPYAPSSTTTTEPDTSRFTDWSSTSTTGNYETNEPLARLTMPTGTTKTGPLSPPVRVSFKTDTQFTATEA
ncbi:MAG TPA: hypothetical protein VJ761_11895 [Ktedonobacteraceae bacterium]|nr:hypothetical protein [Ktedonobacteraceae bacterium]